jgi:glucokinase
VREARDLVKAGATGIEPLLERAGGDVDAITGLMVSQLAVDGDPLATRLIADMGDWLGVGIANLAAALDPGTFVIGGGVSDAGDLLIRPATEAFRRSLTGRGFRPEPRIVRAHLGNQAGMIGAADLARSNTRRGRRRSRSRSRRPAGGTAFGRGLGLSRIEPRSGSLRSRRHDDGSSEH